MHFKKKRKVSKHKNILVVSGETANETNQIPASNQNGKNFKA